MPKIIVVLGPQDSGKTSSIRRFLERRGAIPYEQKDLAVVFLVRKRQRDYAVGVTTAGDNAVALTSKLNFLSQRQCDVIVCAARSSTRVGLSSTQRAVEEFAQDIGWPSPLAIRTRSVAGSLQQKTDHNLVAEKIWMAIP